MQTRQRLCEGNAGKHSDRVDALRIHSLTCDNESAWHNRFPVTLLGSVRTINHDIEAWDVEMKWEPFLGWAPSFVRLEWRCIDRLCKLGTGTGVIPPQSVEPICQEHNA